MQADVLYLVNLLSNSQADPTTIVQYYKDIVDDWSSKEFLTNADLLTISVQEEITLPLSVRSILQVIWDQRELGYLSLRELESLNPSWRTQKGAPTSYTDQAETAKTLALYPTPDLPSKPLGTTVEPLGKDYPVYSMVLMVTEGRQDVPTYLELPLALLILEQEMGRISDHTDLQFSQFAGDFGRFLLSLI